MPVQAGEFERVVMSLSKNSPQSDWMKIRISVITPPVTCRPWKPVMVKKHDANRLTLGRKCPVALIPGG